MEENYDVLICYDINSKHDPVHSAVKECMIKKGYADRFTYSKEKKTVFLPNTTLWKRKINTKTAYDDLKACVDDYNKKHNTNHRIERCIALLFTETWYADYGDPYSSNSSSPEKS